MVTVSDDTTWKMWSLPNGDLVMSGDGHKDWIAGCDFHPHGAQLATGSGDSTVKIWDFANARCRHTFTDHTAAVWGTAYHDCGDEEALDAKNIIIATGARAHELPGLEGDGDLVWTYRTALTPPRMPKKLLVIGSGAIGIEFASFYNTLGADTTVVEVMDRILPVEDAVQKAFFEEEYICEVICPSLINPINIIPILESVKKSKKLILVEEGSSIAGFGSEIISLLSEKGIRLNKVIRISNNTIIPCSFQAENDLLPNKDKIYKKIKDILK